ncbi:AfsR/SARP family transcriptional regulator [Actinokineospora xionganensis]|uniref:Winged helix-turn-helix domain-containing protein n=1 Tax=Actinokineospora xionganensis TaxID=2684470 RepID=A0ABR7LFP8_9PSEU|nr:BTAD domain-containing putative transcriptional regulator [Actinokineospora xionganensis]MBC6451475.1 winged helix-turn-helix domain-containing protein [Actinokineospora xionganensis]
MADVEIRLLGPVEVRIGGQVVALPSERRRSLLCALALAPGRPVSVDALTEAVWGVQTPARVRGSLQTHVMRLRQVLGAEVITTTGNGYRLDVEPDRVDVSRFLGLLDRSAAARDAASKVALLTTAIDLWRGDPLDGVSSAALRESHLHQLTERYLGAVERRIDIELAEGVIGDAVRELRDLLSRHPLREPLWERLIRVLASSGRGAEALLAYAECRQSLADELGVEPGAGMRALHAELLATDQQASRPRRTNPPRQELPGDVSHFTGRADELRQVLDAATVDAASTVVISAIDGMAGVGKTTLAIRAARELAGSYPDGQLWVDLDAHTPGQTPLSPVAALGRLLRAAGVPGDQLPDGLDERVGLWRSTTAGRKMLLVLDNALDSDQVRPLLPGASGCLVLVTSRRRMLELDCSQVLSLDVLPDDDAVALFTRVVGDGRPAVEQAAVRKVIRLCGYLPLAIRLAAARLRHRPGWTVAHLAERLVDHSHRLSELRSDNRDLTAVLELSNLHLDDDTRRTFRLLSVHPGTEFDAHAAAALAGIAPRSADDHLQRLVDVHLVRESGQGRYRMHDLIRAYARQLAVDGEEQRSALGRLIAYHETAAAMAMDVLMPEERHRRPTVTQPAESALTFPDHCAASAWLEAERPNLLTVALSAADSDRPDHTARMTAIVWRHLSLASRNDEAAVLYSRALDVARERCDDTGQVQALTCLAELSWRTGKFREGVDLGTRALDLARVVGDRGGECTALNSLAVLHQHLSEFDAAMTHARAAIAAARRNGDLLALRRRRRTSGRSRFLRRTTRARPSCR